MLKQKFTDLGVEVFEDDTTAKTGHGAGNLICTLKGQKRVLIQFISLLIWIQ